MSSIEIAAVPGQLAGQFFISSGLPCGEAGGMMVPPSTGRGCRPSRLLCYRYNGGACRKISARWVRPGRSAAPKAGNNHHAAFPRRHVRSWTGLHPVLPETSSDTAVSGSSGSLFMQRHCDCTATGGATETRALPSLICWKCGTGAPCTRTRPICGC
jgi:hypothetical protein